MGCSRVIVKTDSLETVDCLTLTDVDNRPLLGIIQNCRFFINRDWYCHMSHIFRYVNGVANGLALLGQSLEENYVFFPSPLTVVFKAVEDDLHGSSVARMSR
ncbi:hypothetical protein ACOSQ2_012961 [Xanthoceras sorbifolium]